MVCRRICTVLTVLVALLFYATPAAWAVVIPDSGASPLASKQFVHTDLQISVAYLAPAELPPQVATRLGGELAALGVPPTGGRVDVRSGRWGTLLLARPLIPGTGAGNGLSWAGGPPASPTALEQAIWNAFTDFLAAHRAELRIDPSELSPAKRVTVQRGGDVVQLFAPRSIAGIPVRDSYLTAVINHGNLVLFGAHGWGDLRVSTAPKLSADDAEARVEELLGFTGASGGWDPTSLTFVPTARGRDVAQVEVGQGYGYRLAWVVRPSLAHEAGRFEALVDATTGELLSWIDTNHYVATDRRVQGGVLPVSNDGTPPDGVEQPGWPMPFDRVQTPSGTVTADSGGNLPAPVDGTITSTLSGAFVTMNDLCGAISLSSTGDIDFGTSAGTDCTTPGFGGPGNTHSSRTGFYELNRIKEMARGQLPANGWLQQQLQANMNINSTCNAFWNGSTVNFYRSGGGCANTGEIAGVFDHEWGHGLDANDSVAGVSNPGEGIADIYMALRLDTSCIGRGFRLGTNCGGYGDPCTGCDGVRDIDFAGRASGQPHDIAWIDANCPFSFSSGPCGGAVHCEGAVYSEAVWDLWKRDLPALFGMDDNTAGEVTTRLTYLGATSVGTWFQCTTPFGGCNSNGGYLNYLAADDDNGNLNDGTPHMQAIFDAFDRHGIACNSPAVANTGCAGTPTVAPVVSGTPQDRGAALSWGAVAGASKYQVFRTDGVHACEFGKVKVGETAGTSFTDTGLQNGRDYFYIVVPIGPADTCMGPASACTTVTPAAGPPAVCGNGVKEGTEECDGADLGGATCSDAGCSGGTVSCNADCTLDFSACTGCTTCGDGTCELGEDCTTCPADCISQDPVSPGCGNGFCEPGIGEDCLSCPADCNGRQNGNPRNQFCCGDGAGTNPVGCGDPRCNSGGFQCSDVLPGGFCCGDLVCEGGEDSFNCEVDCGACVADEPGTELSCGDGVDNDCDQLTDCNDGDCAGDPACVCTAGQPGDACTADVQCCSGKCKGNGTCR